MFEETAYFRDLMRCHLQGFTEKFLLCLILVSVAGNGFCDDNEHRTVCENDPLPIMSLFFSNMTRALRSLYE